MPELTILILYLLTISLVVAAGLFWFSKRNGRSNACQRMQQRYPHINGALQSVPDDEAQLTLPHYFVKTAFNACCGGDYANDYLDLCHLKAVLREGARCLDMELYAIDRTPMVACSTSPHATFVKTSYNAIPLADVLNTLSQYAFSFDGAPNPQDPLILHLRVKTNHHASIASALARLCQKHASLFLGKGFGFETQRWLSTPLHSLRGKLILILDDEQLAQAHPTLAEFVNGISRTTSMRVYTQSMLQDTQELQSFNEHALTLVTPDLHLARPSNPHVETCFSAGCQCVAMAFQQYQDPQLALYQSFFDEKGRAFVPKR